MHLSTKKYKYFIAASLLVISLIAASCSSGTTGSVTHAHQGKTNEMSVFTDALSLLRSSRSISDTLSMQITDNIFSSTTPLKQKRTDLALLSLLPHSHLVITKSISSINNSPVSRYLISLYYSSNLITSLMFTVVNHKFGHVYLKVNVANMTNLPLHYTSSTKNTFFYLSLLLRPVWYGIPNSLILSLASAIKVQTHLNTPKVMSVEDKIRQFLPLLLSDLKTALPKVLTTTVTSTNGITTMKLLANAFDIFKWTIDSNLRAQLGRLYPQIQSNSTTQMPTQAQILALKRDVLRATLTFTSSNLPTSATLFFHAASFTNSSDNISVNTHNHLTYTTSVLPPSTVVAFPSIFVNSIEQSLNAAQK
jgi:hypothetical protein